MDGSPLLCRPARLLVFVSVISGVQGFTVVKLEWLLFVNSLCLQTACATLAAPTTSVGVDCRQWYNETVNFTLPHIFALSSQMCAEVRTSGTYV